MFARRKSRCFFTRIREYLWPSMGWSRTYHYFRHRLFRRGDSTYRITAGMAAGAAVSFSPFMGTHILQALLFSWMIRASWIAALIGTVFGNPWTFPFLFAISYKTGVAIASAFGMEDFVTLPLYMTAAYFTEEPMAFIGYLLTHPFQLLLPLTLGGYVCAGMFWFIAYAALFFPVDWARRVYAAQRARLLDKKNNRKTGVI